MAELPGASPANVQVAVVPDSEQRLESTESFVGPPPSCTVSDAVDVEGPALAALTSNQNGLRGLTFALDAVTDTDRSTLGAGTMP